MAARRWSSAPMRRELVGRQTCAGELSSGERMLAGGRRFPGGCIPAKPPWSEVIIFVYLLLRQSSRLQEEIPCRRSELCQLAQFRRENVRRRRMHGGWLNSGEAAVVGGDRLLACPPPARKPLTGGKSLREKNVVPASSVPARECSPEDVDFPAVQLRRSRRGRR